MKSRYDVIEEFYDIVALRQLRKSAPRFSFFVIKVYDTI